MSTSSHSLRFATYAALAAAIISGVNNFLTKIAVTVIQDATLYTTLKNGIAALFLISLVILFSKISEVRALTKLGWSKLITIGLIGGSIPFALFFTGLQKTSAINGALIHKTLFLWVLIIAIPMFKERLSWQQWLGIVTIFGANIFIGGFNGFSLNSGELMILVATLLWAIENIIAKITLRDISSVTVAAARMTFGTLFLIVYLTMRGTPLTAMLNLTSVQWGWALCTSILLFGYVSFWYAALARAPATYVATLLVPATLITNILTSIFVTRSMTSIQITSSALYIIGIALIIFFAQKATTKQIFSQEFSSSPLR